jgi:hypothetical protein
MVRKVEVAAGIGDLGEGLGEPFQYLDKEDMSDMFRRAMLEKMQLVGEKRNSTNNRDNVRRRKLSGSQKVVKFVEFHKSRQMNQFQNESEAMKYQEEKII